MDINAKQVKELRDKTGAGMMDCKKALKETKGDLEKAIDYLRKKGIQSASSKFGRKASNGVIASYIHMNGKVGVLLEVNCETDFVAKTPDFNDLVKNITLQIAAANPKYLKREEVPDDIIQKEKEVYLTQAENMNKPKHVLDKIAEGKLNKFYQEVCLLEQAYIRDTDKTINQLVLEAIAKLGENIIVKRFVRYELGE